MGEGKSPLGKGINKWLQWLGQNAYYVYALYLFPRTFPRQKPPGIQWEVFLRIKKNENHSYVPPFDQKYFSGNT